MAKATSHDDATHENGAICSAMGGPRRMKEKESEPHQGVWLSPSGFGSRLMSMTVEGREEVGKDVLASGMKKVGHHRRAWGTWRRTWWFALLYAIIGMPLPLIE